MPTLVSMSLAGRRVSRNEARAIADTAASGRPHLLWTVDDRLLISLADDAEPTLMLPVANAMNVRDAVTNIPRTAGTRPRPQRI